MCGSRKYLSQGRPPKYQEERGLKRQNLKGGLNKTKISIFLRGGGGGGGGGTNSPPRAAFGKPL